MKLRFEYIKDLPAAVSGPAGNDVYVCVSRWNWWKWRREYRGLIGSNTIWKWYDSDTGHLTRAETWIEAWLSDCYASHRLKQRMDKLAINIESTQQISQDSTR